MASTRRRKKAAPRRELRPRRPLTAILIPHVKTTDDSKAANSSTYTGPKGVVKARPGLGAHCPSDFCRALFQIECSTFHSYGLGAHSPVVLCAASTGFGDDEVDYDSVSKKTYIKHQHK